MSLRKLFLNHVAQTSPAPMGLEVVGTDGLYLIDHSGKRYIDMISGIGVSSIGHNHPEVVRAVQEQAASYMHTLVYGEFILSPQVKYAEKLTTLLPEKLNSVYFVNSGAEATEGAIKLARRYTKKPNIISCYQSYHGSTTGAMALNSEEYFHQPFQPLMPGVDHIRFNHVDDLALINGDTAAVIIEPVQAERGIYTPNPGYLRALRERTDATGTLLVFDEIQTGFGRTGSLFACQKYGVVPDIMLIAKGMGGGMPLGAFISDRKIMNVFTHDPVLGHITTFGGHPVNCAAALATLNVLTSNNYISDVEEKEKILVQKLKHPQIKQLRTAGLWAAMELKDEDTMHKVVSAGLEKGIIIDWFLFNSRSIRIAPPLIISNDQLTEVCDIIIDILDEL